MTRNEETSLEGTAQPLKKPYSAPAIRELGRLQELTRGGNQEQTGEGPGFSL